MKDLILILGLLYMFVMGFVLIKHIYPSGKRGKKSRKNRKR